jgi:hypothetical protein
MATEVATYLMNPAEDVILFGADLADGMRVMPEFPGSRARDGSEDGWLRGQRFRRVTRLQAPREVGHGIPPQITFVAEWVDGYQEVYSGAVGNAWIVKKDSLPGAAS